VLVKSHKAHRQAALYAQSMPQGAIDISHGQNADYTVNLAFRDRCKVISHDHRIGQQPRSLTFRRRPQYGHATRMIGPKQPAGNHRDNDLMEPGVELVSLDDKGRTQLGCA